ncbi:hypothetical protein ACFL6S_07050 [Candidatus Poribacteria bacterium]
MKKLPDEEKALLQARVDSAHTGEIHRIHGSLLAKVGRVIGEMMAGVAGGFAGLAPFLGVAYGAFEMNDGAGAAGGLALGILLFVVGPITYPLGSAAGVYFAGKRGDEAGSFLATFGGSFLGGLIGIGIWWKWLMAWGQNNFLMVPGLLTAPIIATVVFNLTRKYRSPKKPDESGRRIKIQRQVDTSTSENESIGAIRTIRCPNFGCKHEIEVQRVESGGKRQKIRCPRCGRRIALPLGMIPSQEENMEKQKET